MPVVDITTMGAEGGGDTSKSSANAQIIQAALDVGGAYVPQSAGGFAVANGVIQMRGGNCVMRGEGGMGTDPGEGATSCLAGVGAGDTVTMSGAGGMVERLAFMPAFGSLQAGGDAYLKVTNTQCMMRDLFMTSPNVGISMVLPELAEGEFWLRDILIGGNVKVAGIEGRCGDAAVYMGHVVMYANDPQPSYGVVITSCGELIMEAGCDIIQMGTCLALVPGMGGVVNQHVAAVKLTGCLFDSPNGAGGIYIGPQSNGWVSLVTAMNCWMSTANNGMGAGGVNWPANGITMDGTMATPPAGWASPILNVNLIGCEMRNFVGHCGMYANGVQALTAVDCMASGNFVGLQTKNCAGIFRGNKCGPYSGAPVGVAAAGNVAYGVVLEKSSVVFNPADSLLAGNGVGPYLVIA